MCAKRFLGLCSHGSRSAAAGAAEGQQHGTDVGLGFPDSLPPLARSAPTSIVLGAQHPVVTNVDSTSAQQLDKVRPRGRQMHGGVAFPVAPGFGKDLDHPAYDGRGTVVGRRLHGRPPAAQKPSVPFVITDTPRLPSTTGWGRPNPFGTVRAPASAVVSVPASDGPWGGYSGDTGGGQ